MEWKLETGKLKRGWATMETLLLMPIIAAIVVLIFFVGDYFSTKLQLINAAGSVAIKAGLKNPVDCDSAEAELKSLFPGTKTGCSVTDEFVTITADYEYKNKLPYLDAVLTVISRPIKVSSSAAIVQKTGEE